MQSNLGIMIKNYLTVSFRNLLKNKFYLFINVAGLGLALATCIVAYLNSDFGFQYDRQHVNADKIYKVQIKKASDQGLIDYGFNPLPIGPAALNDLSDVKMFVRYNNPNYIVQRGEKVFDRNIGFASDNFLEMFTFPLKEGDPSALKDKKKILLSEEMADVYFPDEDPMGQILVMQNNDNEEFSYIVGGVFEKLPMNNSIYFDAIVNFENYLDMNEVDKNDWGRFIAATFLYIETPEQAASVRSLLGNYIDIQNEARNDWEVAEYELLPLPEFSKISNGLFANWLNGGIHPAQMMAPPVMAFLILLIACFNFTNTSIAISSRRLKEIGIRKVMGGGKTQLIIQFMSENLIVCAMAIIVALALANYLVPAYSAMWPNMDLAIDFTKDPGMYLFLFSLLIITAVLAGAYPSVYISSFEPVKILRGTLKIGGTSMFSKILLSSQYVFTVIALFAGVAFIQNANYQETLDLGFNRETIIGARVDNSSDYQKLKSSMDSYPDVEQLVGSSNHVGSWNYSTTLKSEGQVIESFMLDFGAGYIETMDMEMVAGRSFKEEFKLSDRDNSLIVNEKLVEEFGWKEPIGKRVAIDDSTTLTVIGVIKNFYHNGFWRDVDPYGIRAGDEEDFRFVIAKVPASKLTSAYHHLEDKWREVIPNKPFEGFYQDQMSTIRQAKLVNGNIVIIFSYLSVISVILSAIGLFTLVSLNLLKRVKEIGVRKVLGAPVPHIVELMNRPFVKMVSIGGILGLAAGYFIIDMMIASIFANHRPIDWSTFFIPLFVLLTISFSTSCFKILGAARRNPVDSLRYE